MLTRRSALLCATLVALAGCSASEGSTVPDGYRLAWSDEFDGAAGARANAATWTYQQGTDWGNQQLEYDTDRTENAALDGNGNLVITAKRESFRGSNYTSARLNSTGKRSVKYGRIEARMKLPRGRGLWPAFWLLGSSCATVGWPLCGEIDIMEYKGQEPSTVYGTAHGPGYFAGGALSGKKTLTAARLDNSFHTYAVEWTATRIDWFIDGERYWTVQKGATPGPWVFDAPFDIILNVAVGGNFVGSPDNITTFPQSMTVDYVRVYEAIP